MLHYDTAFGQHFVACLSNVFVRVADQLAITAGQFHLVPGHDNIEYCYTRFGALEERADGLQESRVKCLVFFRNRKPGRRPGGPFAGRVKPGKPAAHIIAAAVMPFAVVGKIHTAHCDGHALLAVDVSGSTGRFTQPAVAPVFLLPG